MRRRWFDRTFGYGLPAQALPEIVERLRGTADRLAERTAEVTPDRLIRRFDDSWSMLENVGHLLDLEPLWSGRLDDLLAGATTLRAADLQNRGTDRADHNAGTRAALLAAFAEARAPFVARLEALTTDQCERTALHPRLAQPMNAVDLAFFVAEHDDHHLARLTELRHR